MKAETLLAAVDGLIALRPVFTTVTGNEMTATYLASKILLSTGADVSVSSVKAALEVFGIKPTSGGRYFDDDIHAAINGGNVGQVREQLIAWRDRRETGPPPPANR